jgi:hypothetical protein
LQLHELLADVGYLESKLMIGPCLKLLRKGQKLGELHDRFTELLRLLDIERRLIKLGEGPHLIQELDRIEADRKSILHRMEVQYAYVELYDRLYATLRQQIKSDHAAAVQALRDCLSSALLTDSQWAASFQAKSYFLLCNAFCRQLLREFDLAKALHAQNIALWEAHPHWIEQEPFQYQRAISNYLGLCQLTDDWAPFPAALSKIESLAGGSLEQRAEHFNNYYSFALTYGMNVGDFEGVVARSSEIEAGLAMFGTKIPASRRLNFQYNLTVLHFFLGKPRLAIHWLNTILHAEKTEVRQDLQRAARLFLILLHYELGNFDLAEHLFTTVRRYLRQTGVNEFEQPLLEFLQALYADGGLSWPRDRALALQTSLAALAEAHSDAHFPGIREVIIWLHARSEGKTMVEVAKAHAG